MSANVPETWPLGYVVVCPACEQSHEVDEVDLADPAAHPYDHPAFGRMFNFECPNCRTQNGIAYDHSGYVGTASAKATIAAAVEPPVEPPPGEAVGVTGEEVNEYEDGAHS